MSLAAWLCETVTAQSTGASGKYDVFDEDNYGAFTSVTNVPEKGIAYTSTDGAFTFAEDGTYRITWNLFGSIIAPLTVIMSIEIATVEVWTATPGVSSVVDMERSDTITVDALAGQALHAFVNSGTTFTVEPGTTMSVEKIG